MTIDKPTMNYLLKGQLISKCLFGFFNSPKKRTKKFDFTTMVPQVELFSNLFVTSKNEVSNSPIHEFKMLQNVFKIKKTRLKMFLKVINKK